ncbi:RNA polymerase sigma-54 factor [Alteribacter lacisalsi]|uniref:RNA polymerase sigma-54 factor n=1 Tax=Alteribacter lacisalsi TaxID=2045244 RepID=A0A2W0H6R7_9BACI|nr:RNA polymerase factor sigma-54 [Alteribacter lacisalsi]PYZ95800.1 RNA polymerase sigma-54 factor [Alteribacter lacisalsi]
MMNMDLGLYQQQTMKLVMTNELRQAITILQYSALDLNHYLHEQQLENPLIELKEKRAGEELVRDSINLQTPHFDSRRNNHDSDDEYSAIDHVSSREEGLQDALLRQIRFLEIPEKQRRIVIYLALNTDENGYLPYDIETFAEELDESVEDTRGALAVLQGLEPAGIGAVSLKDCLLLQLRQLENRDPLAERVVENDLDLLGSKQYKKIAKKEGVTLQDVQSVADLIKTLNPKPGAAFYDEPAEYVTPDVTVKKIEGQYQVILNDQYIPKVFVNPNYEKMLQEQDAELNHYLKQKKEQLQWIIKSIAQRQETLRKVTEAVVSHQEHFLEDGPGHLKPLTLKQIAEQVGVHESTVSRATTRKYIQTPQGVYELKYFFTSMVGAGSGNGDGASSEKVKIYLKRLVDQESKNKPLSDQKLADLLKSDYDIRISRRTVAKYRDEMHIPSSSRRKRYA